MGTWPGSEIAFSQVREDPLIDLQVVHRVARERHRRVRGLLVASGGCTALSLLTSAEVDSLVAVDVNPAQLRLTELKLAALKHLSLADQLLLLGEGGAARENQRVDCYQRLRPQLVSETSQYWDARPREVAFGVNLVGRYEQTFRELMVMLAEAGLDPVSSPHEAIASPAWRTSFGHAFERQALIDRFGQAAVEYSMHRSFADHFATVFADAAARYPAVENYFLHSVWADAYVPVAKELPLYLQAREQEAIGRRGPGDLELRLGVFADELDQLADAGPFDFIQSSNISDWMPVPELHRLIEKIANLLSPGGALLARRLNGDHDLAAIVAQHLAVDAEFSTELMAVDRSFFYSELVVGFKR